MKLIPTKSGKLYVGKVPSSSDLSEIDNLDIIWNLANEFCNLKLMEENYTKTVLLGKIKDYSIPANIDTFIRQLRLVVDCLKNNGNIFVHCFAGHGRTGMATACILFLINKISIDEALILAKKFCSGPETERQIRFVKTVCEKL
jgi:protein tyrosine/serine phosphatase